ncbi:hypothetical protein [Arthrobacter sp. NA-172]|uniref:hypothetical protein n=1 Tax=Arthrobacter sp. NA-172 TaxID=3367524 RepID=UPI003753EB76
MTTTLQKPADLQQTVPPAGATRPKRLGQRAIGFFMALPPILLIALFVGFPIVLAFGFSIGLTGGLNHTIATIGQNVHEADAWWGTLAAYQEMFTNKRFLGDLLVTVMVTLVSTATVIFAGHGHWALPQAQGRPDGASSLWLGDRAALHPGGHRLVGDPDVLLRDGLPAKRLCPRRA